MYLSFFYKNLPSLLRTSEFQFYFSISLNNDYSINNVLLMHKLMNFSSRLLRLLDILLLRWTYRTHIFVFNFILKQRWIKILCKITTHNSHELNNFRIGRPIYMRELRNAFICDWVNIVINKRIIASCWPFVPIRRNNDVVSSSGGEYCSFEVFNAVQCG